MKPWCNADTYSFILHLVLYIHIQHCVRFINILKNWQSVWINNFKRKTKFIEYPSIENVFELSIVSIHFIQVLLGIVYSICFAMYNFYVSLRLNWPNWLNNSHMVLWRVILYSKYGEVIIYCINNTKKILYIHIHI